MTKETMDEAMLAEAVYQSPENDPFWRARLNWLLEDVEPDLILELWNSPGHLALIRDLDLAVMRASEMAWRMGLPFREEFETLIPEICPTPENLPERELPEETREEILDWLEEKTEAWAEIEGGRVMNRDGTLDVESYDEIPESLRMFITTG